MPPTTVGIQSMYPGDASVMGAALERILSLIVEIDRLDSVITRVSAARRALSKELFDLAEDGGTSFLGRTNAEILRRKNEAEVDSRRDAARANVASRQAKRKHKLKDRK